MPIGRLQGSRAADRGYTYLGLLLLLAVLGAALAEAATVWRTQTQRWREAELRFRGEQIKAAIAHYREASPQRGWPTSLEALVEDRRGGRVRHHLRRLWTDPFTGAADWVLLPAPDAASRGGIAGVRSRSQAERISDPTTPTLGPRPAVSDWRFETANQQRPATMTPGQTTETGRRAP